MAFTVLFRRSLRNAGHAASGLAAGPLLPCSGVFAGLGTTTGRGTSSSGSTIGARTSVGTISSGAVAVLRTTGAQGRLATRSAPPQDASAPPPPAAISERARASAPSPSAPSPCSAPPESRDDSPPARSRSSSPASAPPRRLGTSSSGSTIGARTSVGIISSGAVAVLRTTGAQERLATRSKPLLFAALPPRTPSSLIRSLSTDNKGGGHGNPFWAILKQIEDLGAETEQQQEKLWAVTRKFTEDVTRHRSHFSFYMNVLTAFEFAGGLVLAFVLYPFLTAAWRKEEREKMNTQRQVKLALDEISGRAEVEKKRKEERARMEKMMEEAASLAPVGAAGRQG